MYVEIRLKTGRESRKMDFYVFFHFFLFLYLLRLLYLQILYLYYSDIIYLLKVMYNGTICRGTDSA